jgi:hypothetical protein
MQDDRPDEAGPHPGGRPPKYKPEYIDQAYKLALLHATDVEIAKFFDVVPATLYNWKTTYPEFAQAIRNGKEIADMEVASSLFKRATGYSVTEEVLTKSGEVVSLAREIPADVKAQTYWLNNRTRHLENAWRDKQEITGADGKDLIPELASDNDLARRIAFLLTKATTT